MQNPYSGRGVPVSGERLVGRQNIVERIAERISSEAHCSIVGLPRIGKTSISREILNTINIRNENIKAVYLSLDAISSPIQVYKRIISEMNLDDNQLSANGTLHDDVYESFIRLIRKQKNTDQRYLVIIDEFDGVARSCFDDGQLFISRLREIANYRERYGITFLFISRRSLDMIQGTVECSTLAGLCEVIYLRPLDFNGIEKLAERSPIKVDSRGIDTLWYYTGGHPFLAEIIMCEALEKMGEGISSPEIEDAQNLQAHEFTNYYNQLNKMFSKNNMFDYFREIVVGPQWRDVDVHTMTLFKHYGLLKSHKDQNNDEQICISAHFEEYLKLLSRITPSWMLLGETEKQLRIIVNDRMHAIYGKDWLDFIFSKNNQRFYILEKLQGQMKKEKKIFGDEASSYLLDYSYISDLKQIISQEWDNFSPIIGRSKSEWNELLKPIMEIRNPIAHHRQIPADKLRQAELACESVQAILNRYNDPKTRRQD